MILKDPGNNGHSYIAYLTMEVGLDPSLPTYSGGLGVLAGDTLKAAADLGLPLVGVTLLHRKGYFVQRLHASGQQVEEAAEWKPQERLEKLEPVVQIRIDDEPVRIGVWRYIVHGVNGHQVPVYFLDTCLPENSAAARAYTDRLYGGDALYRLCQEVVLGMGGVAILRALGHRELRAFHMNEGHSALLTLALLEERGAGQSLADLTQEDEERVRERCVFTTHTPVPAGHDQFPLDLARRVLGEERVQMLVTHGYTVDGTLNMTYLALALSRYVNGVAMSHGKISRGMFPNYPIDSITNGVHVPTWISAAFADLFDRHIPEWRLDSQNLRYAVSVPLEEIRGAHLRAKQELLDEVYRRSAVRLDPKAMTIGFARRAATYKRADLVFSDLDRLKRIARDVGPLQFIYGGKAHPHDQGGKDLIRRVFTAAEALRGHVSVVYLEEYDMAVAKVLCSGVDLWMNTPRKPQEASGTSGMKAAINGVPSFSVLDGWWIEGHVEGVTGWSIGESWEVEDDDVREAASLYDKLETVILPMFYGRPSAYARIMRHAIALNASFFNARRMVLQYRENAYRL
jgi:starch phosphorylase